MENVEYDFSKFEKHVNLFNLGLSALISPEQGEGQLSDEGGTEALRMQMEYYEKALSELKKSLNHSHYVQQNS